ncbi:putative chain agglutinin ssa protein [Botrytis fragariae]|uniref:Putative chain agglutinin ssa protein n=1 Tax=Botrytis fragariae TaxID=1964551 RepID=A0A8H6AZ81_9HELO|nr:putative chain agglutinin ssa protein [Botrytis fragariae]KAF5876321.1 putative chain agglutinin ssa protein [Botrytis fragariae]
MVFNGVGTYEIVPYQAPTLNLNAWDGLLTPGAVVRTYARGDTPSDNAKWQVALVAGSGDSAEYLIINVRSGFFLTATGDNKIASTPQISPTDQSARWTIKASTTNGYQVFTINSKISSRGQLSVKDFSTQSGADILSATSKNGDNQKWYFDAK